MTLQPFVNQSIKLFKIYLLSLLFFMVARLANLLRFAQWKELEGYGNDLIFAFVQGFRFDTVAINFGLVLIAVLNLLVLIPYKPIEPIVNKVSMYFAIFALSAFCIGLSIDHEYYTYFQSHINVFIFNLVEDDTTNIFKSIWTDHHPFLFIIVWLILIWGIYRLVKRIYMTDATFQIKGLVGSFGFFLLFNGLFFLGLRGSWTEFTLLIDDASVSGNSFVNYLAPNGFFTLKEAFREKSDIFEKKDNILGGYGFANEEEAFSTYPYQESLWQTTPTDSFLLANPPHVVFVVMESMGTHFFDLHQKEKNNLLGELESHWQELLMFKNFVSAQNGTIVSLEELFINAPIHSITQSKHKLKTFESSIAKPFKEAGYETSFFTGGKISWQNLEEFIPHEYFDNVAGNGAIERHLGNTQSNDWGVYDEYLFEYAFDKIQKSKQPQFHFLLTTTNHTPFNLPSHYQPLPVSLTDSIRQAILPEEEIALNSFKNFQYANDCLGKFITKIKNSPQGKNTIIVVTGDHNSLILFPFSDEKVFQRHATPLICYIPEAYKKQLHIKTDRFGSHKDIAPTIFNLALSNARFMSLGNNLFAPDSTKRIFFGLNDNHTLFSEKGVIKDFLNNEKAVFYRWDKNQQVVATQSDSTFLQLQKQAKATVALWHHWFNQQF